MPFVKGSVKGVIAVTAGLAAQVSGQIPRGILCGPLAEYDPYLSFVVGAFVGLVVSDVLSGDVSPGRPALGFFKGLTAAVGAAIPLVLGDFGWFVTFCDTQAGAIVEQFVGAGRCYAYLKLVVGAFVGVLIGDVVHFFFRK